VIVEKCMTFKDIFPGLSRTLSFNFQDFQDESDFPGLSRSWNFQEKKSRTFQDFAGGMGTLCNGQAGTATGQSVILR